MGKPPPDQRTQAAPEASDTLGKIADQYLKHAKQEQRPKTYSEVDRYPLTSWKPLHPVSVFLIRRRHVATRVAEMASDLGAVTAAGSPGNETDYFGTLTIRALIRFQNANATAILQPAGLSAGTGYFGPPSVRMSILSSSTNRC
jgi:hypothetical protein